MQRITEFVLNHPLLWSLMAAALVALAASELWRLLRGPKPLPPGDAVRLINSHDAVMVDVRSASDFKKGHILNAVNVPMAGIGERAREISKDKGRTIVCYCAMGSVSSQACAKLEKLGYTDAHTLKGGINAWQSAGLPVTRK